MGTRGSSPGIPTPPIWPRSTLASLGALDMRSKRSPIVLIPWLPADMQDWLVAHFFGAGAASNHSNSWLSVLLLPAPTGA